ncbi:MAG: hypothetical protein N3E36_04410 [Sulfolobales archaeon]|nr:hypothetical protein [Sulfolobales archaeon]
MRREEVLLDNALTKRIAFIARLINFLEDLVDDAFCREIYVNEDVLLGESAPSSITIDAVGCEHDVVESARTFSREWLINSDVRRGPARVQLSSLYRCIYELYMKYLHPSMKQYSLKTYARGVEYCLALLFDGRGIIIEGERSKVVLPYFKHFLSAHTHPSGGALPSKVDLKTMLRLFIDRGLLYSIVTPSSSMIVYRVAPLTEESLNLMNKVVNNRVEVVLNYMKSFKWLEITLVA